MSEIKKSLYRIYRPTNFSEVACHENLKTILTNEIKNNSFPHALMFSGQRGTGKTSVAKIFAKTINCKNKVGFEPCNNCESCSLANNNSHPDIFEIDAASNNGVDEIRNIKNNVSTLPTIAEFKVYIIDEFHMLTNSAFNALLKTLEEPPKHIIFILATTELNKIPATIISRCQGFNFQKISKSAMKNKLNEISTKENIKIDSDALDEIFYLSDGSLRDALNVLEQLMVFEKDEIKLADLKLVFNVASKKEKIDLLLDIFKGQVEKIIKYFEVATNSGVDFNSLALSLLEILKEIIEYKLTNNLEFKNVLEDEELEHFKIESLENLFLVSDILSEVYAKTKTTTINQDFMLVNILKVIYKLGKDNIKNINKKDVENKTEENKAIEIETNQTAHEEIEVDLVKPENEPQPKVEVIDGLNEVGLQKIILEQIVEYVPSSVKKIVVSDKKIFNVILGANKEQRNFVNEKIDEIFVRSNDGYFANEEIVKKFSLFWNGKIVAACENGFILVCDHDEVAEILNFKLQEDSFQNDIFSILQSPQAIIAISKESWKNIKEDFIKMKNDNELWDHEQINVAEFYQSIIKKINKVEEKELTSLEEMKNIFGEDNIEVID
ncbi:DNA polymerase III subunit gamma/tau [Spiroplasma alleghenense]|uniref:DNA polymerase III subunit gamma/tau n=1 Tax=Spiroplasma alleghenense TaxID=216931 RepID=A0A345Z254_9MOLU|nr:DNA polymerase III subunit gamma/tau [Spiroplasma alleghenense]AXK50683.1 DNA polymerase III subunits gamma and tau [Spiroplasma alleghenense]